MATGHLLQGRQRAMHRRLAREFLQQRRQRQAGLDRPRLLQQAVDLLQAIGECAHRTLHACISRP